MIYNEIWESEDGHNWVLIQSNAFDTARALHSAVVYNNKLYVYGGLDNKGNFISDI